MSEDIQLRVISLGAGVQSTAMLLMALRGEFGDTPNAAIFADTGWEPPTVYQHLDWLEREVAPFPIHRVAQANIREQFYRARSNGGRFVSLPVYTTNPDGSEGIGRRQCTYEFKVKPIDRQINVLLRDRGVRRRRGVVCVEQWIGISLDEFQRMKDNHTKYIRNRWPLVEARRSRHDCANWLAKHGYPEPPKSACLGCPYHSNHQWRFIRDHYPKEWREVVEFDAAYRRDPRGLLSGNNYLHRSRVPLDQVDLRTAEDHGQLSMFDQECEGLCGV